MHIYHLQDNPRGGEREGEGEREGKGKGEGEKERQRQGNITKKTPTPTCQRGLIKPPPHRRNKKKHDDLSTLMLVLAGSATAAAAAAAERSRSTRVSASHKEVQPGTEQLCNPAGKERREKGRKNDKNKYTTYIQDFTSSSK